MAHLLAPLRASPSADPAAYVIMTNNIWLVTGKLKVAQGGKSKWVFDDMMLLMNIDVFAMIIVNRLIRSRLD